ncbi:MAG TPA: MFS transporter [Terriglobales bacterium]|nr:MFS transporter [Terriglobales bacterium]
MAARSPWLTPTGVANAAFIPTGIVNVILAPLLPVLAARWSLTDTQSGGLFAAQFLGSSLGTILSGRFVLRMGYRNVLMLGLTLMALGLGILLLGARLLGMGAATVWGVGLGLTIPTANLLVAQVNPARRAAALNRLNFSWSVGAVLCPFLLAPFLRRPLAATFLVGLAGAILVLAAALWPAVLPAPAERAALDESKAPIVRLLSQPPAAVLALLFFLYVGVENSTGGWLASYARRIAAGGVIWATIPSFFYGALLLGRGVAHLALRRAQETQLVRWSLVTAVFGLIVLVSSRTTGGVMEGSIMAGVGLSVVYPITIAVFAQLFGDASTRLGAVMFTMGGLGGATVPWLVGFVSTRFFSLKMGLLVPLGGCILMLGLYRGRWSGGTGRVVEAAEIGARLIN